MNAIGVVLGVLGGLLVGKLVLGRKDAQVPDAAQPVADPAAPTVPVDEKGNVVVQTAAPSAADGTGKAKIPMPKKSATFKQTPRFLTSGGVYYYNPAFRETIKQVLFAYGAAPTNPQASRVTLVQGPGAGNAQVWAIGQQAKGLAVVAPMTLYDGPQGQVGAALVAVPKSSIDPQHLGTQFAVLPSMNPET